MRIMLDDEITSILKAAITSPGTDTLDAVLPFAAYDIHRNWLIVEAARNGRSDLVKHLVEIGWFPDLLANKARERISLMQEAVERGPEIYRPSAFWKEFNSNTMTLLSMFGHRNFKRSINQMYGNFLPKSIDDTQFTSLRKYRRPRNGDQTARFELRRPTNDPDYWFTFYEPLRTFGADWKHREKLYVLLIARLYDYLDAIGLGAIVRQTEEPSLGNPIPLYRGGQLVSQDVATSIDEWAFVERWSGNIHSPPRRTIGELGAGYGRLAYIFLAATRCRYMIFDIPPALHISEWYLSKIFPDRRVFHFRPFSDYASIRDELDAADVAFFTPDQLELLPADTFDLFVSISSLHEMRRDQISHYIGQIDRLTNGHIFIKQYLEYENPTDKLIIKRSEYPFDKGWKHLREEISGSNPRFFQIMFATR
jgi:putative sugar O-methyltransferase